MKKKLILVLALLAFTSSIAIGSEEYCKPVEHAKVPTITNFTYHKARKALLKAGWQPLQSKSFNDAAKEASEDPEISSGNGAIFWEKGYVEVEGCAGSGLSPCAFLFKDIYNNQLRITTAGEEHPKEKVHAKVTGFNFVCTP